MLITELLYEMPMHHNDLSSHELNTPDGNHTYYRKYIKGAKLVNELSPAIGIYHSNRRYPTYLVLDKSTERVLYFMQYSVANDQMLGKYVYQKFLWIDPTKRHIVGKLPTHYFYELINEYQTIATDSEQTLDGRRFWVHRIGEAFSRGLNVYYYDLATGMLLQLSGPADVAAFDNKYQIYSTSESSLDRVFVITSTTLEVTDPNVDNTPVAKPSMFAGLTRGL